MTKKLHSLAAVVAACAALSAFPSHAQVANSGLYLGGSYGQSKYKGEFPTAIDRSDSGGKVFVGYEFTPNVALELGGVSLGEFNSDFGTLKGEGTFLDLVGKLPFTPQLSGLARVGAFNGKGTFDSPLPGVSESERNIKPKFGLGLQYDFTQNFSLRGEWERYRFENDGDKHDADLATVGVNFRF